MSEGRTDVSAPAGLEVPPAERTWRAEAVAEDITRVSLPYRTLGFVNVYLFRGRHGWALVDTGFPDAGCRSALDDCLRKHGIADEDLQLIVVTHGHPDHSGQARDLALRTGATVALHPAAISGDPREHAWLAANGVRSTPHPADLLASLQPVPRSQMRFVNDGDRLTVGDRRLEVMLTPGHSPSLFCAYQAETGLLLAGDRVMAVPTRVPRLVESDDPLGGHLAAHERLRRLDVRRVLPGHGRTLPSAADALEADHRWHQQNLRRVYDAIDPGGSTAVELQRRVDMATRIGRVHAPGEREVLATGVVLACLRQLEERGSVLVDAGVRPVRYHRATGDIGR